MMKHEFVPLVHSCNPHTTVGHFFHSGSDMAAAREVCASHCSISPYCAAFNVYLTMKRGTCMMTSECDGPEGPCDSPSVCGFRLKSAQIAAERTKAYHAQKQQPHPSAGPRQDPRTVTRQLQKPRAGGSLLSSKYKNLPRHNSTYRAFSGKAYPGDQQGMRQYFQSHWHPGTPDGADCAHVRRFGAQGDGGKLVCLDAVPSPPSPCYVLSIGHGSDWSFEDGIHAALPHCEIEVYDGTNFHHAMPKQTPSYLKFFPINFNRDHAALHKSKHGTKPIDIFKIDCEGCEMEEVAPFLEKTCVRQMQIEIHGGNRYTQTHALMTAINRSFGVFYNEPNVQFSDGTCVEFAMRRREDVPCPA
uniref:Methyltransferase domain-containing protein n=1 Tax=Chrysotila carterae TaxID=13221 RepID=A0A7S4C3J4_CHRCT|mmetsp:Transcript_22899/g.50064  ORF Transcript_22899/g.50064 Transcript_22899/m.50064 type:complete len:358 (+) Transcript_22899:179-1252(+)